MKNTDELEQKRRKELILKIKDSISKQMEPSPREKYDQAMWRRTNDPEYMPADRLREFQSVGWFTDYTPRELTPEQQAIEEKEFDDLFNAAYPDKIDPSLPVGEARLGQIIDEAFSPENSLFKRKERELKQRLSSP